MNNFYEKLAKLDNEGLDLISSVGDEKFRKTGNKLGEDMDDAYYEAYNLRSDERKLLGKYFKKSKAEELKKEIEKTEDGLQSAMDEVKDVYNRVSEKTRKKDRIRDIYKLFRLRDALWTDQVVAMYKDDDDTYDDGSRTVGNMN